MTGSRCRASNRLIAGPSAFDDPEMIFLPFTTAVAAEMEPQGSVDCYGTRSDDLQGYRALTEGECVWIQFWVELDSAAAAAGHSDYLAGYVAQQRELGRFSRPNNNRLHNVMSWLEENDVVSSDARLQTYLAFGFLLVCLVNTIGLLLAKFTARAGDIGVRRALGAPRRAIFQQYLLEAGVVGLAGGLLGLLLTFGCLWLVGRQSDELGNLAKLDWLLLVITFVLAVSASFLAGLFPTWRACQVQPAAQLKSQ